MGNALSASIAALAIALAVGALLVNWEYGPPDPGLGIPMQEGRAALAVDPDRPDHPPAR